MKSELDISSELYRIYTYTSGATFRIDNPITLHIIEDEKGATHRVVDEDGKTHRPERGWVGVTWKPRDGEPEFIA